jgi:hypothetical protein
MERFLPLDVRGANSIGVWLPHNWDYLHCGYFGTARDILVKNRNIAGRLCERIRLLERENAQLKKEVEFFRRTPTLAQGLKGETLIASLTRGVRTGYKDPKRSAESRRWDSYCDIRWPRLRSRRVIVFIGLP